VAVGPFDDGCSLPDRAVAVEFGARRLHDNVTSCRSEVKVKMTCPFRPLAIQRCKISCWTAGGQARSSAMFPTLPLLMLAHLREVGDERRG
jgi:hypothetical protein